MKYRVNNWAQYNQALVDRGNISLLFSPKVADQWFHQSGQRKRGGQWVYSDRTIEIALTLRAVFHLTLRSTQGFLIGLGSLLNIHLKIPSFSTLSRRGPSLEIPPLKMPSNESLFIIVDSTGLKIYGEGEWLSEKHKAKRRRSWPKLHLVIDPCRNGVASTLTDHLADDAPKPCRIC